MARSGANTAFSEENLITLPCSVAGVCKSHISDSKFIKHSQSTKAWVDHVSTLQAYQRANLSIFLCISYALGHCHKHQVIWIFLHQSVDHSNLFQPHSDCIFETNVTRTPCCPKLNMLKQLYNTGFYWTIVKPLCYHFFFPHSLSYHNVQVRSQSSLLQSRQQYRTCLSSISHEIWEFSRLLFGKYLYQWIVSVVSQ